MPWGETYTGFTLVDMYLAELATHTWDLAAATDQLGRLDSDLAATALDGARAMLKPGYRNLMGDGSPFGTEVPAGPEPMPRVLARDGLPASPQRRACSRPRPRPRSSTLNPNDFAPAWNVVSAPHGDLRAQSSWSPRRSYRVTARPATVGTPKATGMHRRRICTRIAAETALAVVGSGAVCFLAYFLLGLPIPSPGVGGEVMVIAPFATPLLIAPFVAMPFARASQRISDLLAEVEQARRELTEEVAERVLVQERLAELARRDPLTGLLDRRGFFELSSERADRELAVMVVDVDDFKRVNDERVAAVGVALPGADRGLPRDGAADDGAAR